MPNLTADQLSQLSDDFMGLAQAIGNLCFDRRHDLSNDEKQTLLRNQNSCLKVSEDLLANATVILMDDADNALQALDQVTKEVRQSIENIQKVQKAIDVATSAVQLAAAVFSKNPQTIANSLQNLIDTWHQSVDDNQ